MTRQSITLSKNKAKHIFDEDDDEKAVTIDDETGCAENDYVICPICGAISGEADAKLEAPCDHAASNYIKLSKVTVKNTKQIKCSACGFGHLRRFYLGAEAATSVLGTKLFDILPETEETPIPKENRTSGRGLFAAPQYTDYYYNNKASAITVLF